MQHTTTNACRFCAIAHGVSGEPHDRVWLESDDFAAVVSVGALVPGWSLVVPQEHVMNMSQHLTERATHTFIGDCVKKIEQAFGPVTLFEHGCTAAQSPTGCGVGHAHLHLVPLDFSLAKAVFEFDADLAWQACQLSELASLAAGQEYLYFADTYAGSETAGHLLVLEKGISQFFRRVIAWRLGREAEYDYKEHGQLEVVTRSLALLEAPLEKAA